MAWCRQATSHYLSQCWPRSMSPYGVTRPQWVKCWPCFAPFQAFIASDITFAMKPYFRGPFCTQDVREGFVVAFLKHITQTCNVSDHFDCGCPCGHLESPLDNNGLVNLWASETLDGWDSERMGTIKSLIKDPPNLKTEMFLISSCSCLYLIHWTQVLSP